ncbi:MAG TPA: hypothetical protein VGI19_02000 [Candidatus Cybelea sp.]
MNQRALFGLSMLFSFLAWGAVVGLYLWPAIGTIPAKTFLLALIAPHMFRFVGLSFLIPGVVSQALPQEFARPAAWGDLIAAFLAIIATIALAAGARWAIVLVWAFNIWGTLDLLNAMVQGPIKRRISEPGALGATFFIPTLIVPGLLASHAVIFKLLVS